MGNLQVEQIGADINEGLDPKVAPTIRAQPLTPEYSLAALNYAVYQYRRLYSLLTIAVFWHPLTLSVLLGSNGAFVAYRYREVVEYSGWSAMLRFYESDTAGLIQVMLFFMATFAAALFYGKMSGYFLREASDAVRDNGGGDVFGVSLRKFLIVDEEKWKRGEVVLENAQVVVYRNRPIAVASVLGDDNGQSADRENAYKITVLGAKNVYIRTGIFEDLLAWAVGYARQQSKDGQFTLSVDAYSFDRYLTTLLGEKGFIKVRSEGLRGALGSVFGFEKATFQYAGSSASISDAVSENSEKAAALQK